jgi:hypothetical protein
MGDFNFEESLSNNDKHSRDTQRTRMLDAYARVCAKLGDPAVGGLEEAYTILTRSHTQSDLHRRHHVFTCVPGNR